MIEKLFSSKVTFAVLNALFNLPDKPLSTSELIGATNKNQANIQRELDKLATGGLVLKIKKGNQNYYQLNKNYQYFNSLSNLLNDYNHKSQKYILLNEESGTCFLSVDYILRAYINDYGVRKGVVSDVLGAIAVYKNDYGQYYFIKDVIEKGAEESLKKLLKDPSFVFKTIYPESIACGEEVQEIFERLKKRDFQVPKTEAIKLFDKFLEIISIQIGLNTIAVFDLKDQLYSNYLKKYLIDKTKNSPLSLGVAMEKLLAPEKLTSTQLLRIELLKLALREQISQKSFNQAVDSLQYNWSWLNYGYVGPGLERSYFAETLKELQARPKEELNKELSDLLNNEKVIKHSKREVYQQLRIDEKHQKFIDALGLLSYLKIHRKDTAFLIFSCLYQIFAKIMPSYKKKDLFNLTIEESKDLLRDQLKVSGRELRDRSNYCAYIYHENRFLYGKEVDKCLAERTIADSQETATIGLKLLEGTAACLGKTGNWVYGEVRVINSSPDMAKMRDGDILVSVATTPDILPAMKKAAAIVTDHGGITCHAAIVSRELNIPCLIATKYATKVFKDGDKVVVCPRHNYIKFQ